ncbi:phosphate signaling complex protein PhoU [Merismopedia glauca]|uniref:Phosphate-specific transport system accessory protein PhoU n=1 Tax=Merismopedia glauca CCAP 1448/3 TaxID=1296344 RepID=A0A2T1BWM7_9CYAN|nr:phosphate signaling complex protein PhoU [Merismopedia glauca]PSB00416.1 phosphate transport system regulatory protein PhoU [Merismopedia glauca CCAP 1448/3]
MNFQSLEPSLNKSQFKRKTKRLEQDVLRMGALVEKSFRLSHQALFERQLSLVNEVTLLDKEIDRFQKHIELECVALISLESPVAQELRLLSASMQLVRDLERIGDYAKDLGEIAVKIFPYPRHSCLGEIEAMSNHAQAMLASSLEALADLNAVAGKQVKQLDNTVDRAYQRIYQTLAYQKDISGFIEPILLMVLVIRHLERMADHATNIGQRVGYIVTGTR